MRHLCPIDLGSDLLGLVPSQQLLEQFQVFQRDHSSNIGPATPDDHWVLYAVWRQPGSPGPNNPGPAAAPPHAMDS